VSCGTLKESGSSKRKAEEFHIGYEEMEKLWREWIYWWDEG